MKEQTNGERFDEFMKLVQYPELEGTMNLCKEIIEKRTGKMTEEEWQAAERAQRSAAGKDTSYQKEFMTIERIKEIQNKTAYPNSISVQQALLQVWNECVTSSQTEISDEEIEKFCKSNNPYPSTKQGSVDWEHGFITAIEWYKEQIRIRNEKK